MYNAFEKQPGEKYPISVDYLDRMDTGETVSSCAASAYKITWAMGRISSSTAATAILSSVTHDDGAVQTTVSAGVDGESYKVSISATTSDGKVLEEDILMWVIAK